MLLAGILGLSMLLRVSSLGVVGGMRPVPAAQTSAQNSNSSTQQTSSTQTSASPAQPSTQASQPQSSASTNNSPAKKPKKKGKKETPPPAKDSAAAADDQAPKKKVVTHGGTDQPTTQLSASMTEEQAAKSRASTASLLSQTDSNLQKLSGRQLSAEEQETVDQIRKFEEQSKTADQQGDLPRAASLANKAKLLSDALIKP
jgi:hypothetical protein